METVTLTIDGQSVTVPKGKTVLEAVHASGGHVPYYCYHPGLQVDGSCRVCIVKIEKMPKLQTSCSTVCTDGMVVTPNSPDVEAARASVFEFLLVITRSTAPSVTRAVNARFRIIRTPTAPSGAAWSSRAACLTAKA